VSLLNKVVEDIVIYHEVTSVDSDGNTMTRASSVGVPAQATIQATGSSGTAGRRAEQDNEGFESEANYRLRLKKDYPAILGAQAKIEWRGEIWSIVGDAKRYNGSRRTSHVDYMIRRA
jgi:hypothetical protein